MSAPQYNPILQPAEKIVAFGSIFVVDDESYVANLIGIALRISGFTVELFTDPTRALAAFTYADPSPVLLIVDQAMPRITGMELIQRCKALRPQLQTLLISGQIGPSDLNRFSIKPDHFLEKPVRPKLIRTVVNNLLSKRLV